MERVDQPAVGEGIERNARQPQPGFGTASLWPYMLHWFSGRLCTGRTAGGASARVEEICRFTGRAAGPRSNSAMLSQQPPSSLPRACTKAWSLDGACASWASRLAASEPPERHLRRHVPRQRPRDFSVQTAWDSCLPTSWEAPGPGTIRGRLGRDSPEKNEGSSPEKDTILCTQTSGFTLKSSRE